MSSEKAFQTNGVSLNVAVWTCEDSKSPPLVLVHGIWDTWKIFAEIGETLSRRRTVYALDLRGHGMSDKPTSGYSYADYSADVSGVIDQIPAARVDLFGYSMGTAISVFVATRSPRLRRLVLEDPPLHPRERSRAAAAAWLELKHRPVEDVVSAMRVSYPARPRELIDENARTLMGTADGALESIARGDLDVDWPQVLADVRIPTLVLRADPAAGGLLSDENSARLVRLIPDGRLVEFPGCGHSIHGERPRALVDALEGFLA